MPEFRSTLEAGLNRLDHLATLPAVVAHLLEVIDDPLVSILDVAYTLREDPPLTARVLRMANSPVYGTRVRITSIPQAVLRLGMIEIRNLVMSLGMIKAMAGFGRRLDYHTFWQHSLTIALATESLATRSRREGAAVDDGAFAAGLLHDIGRLVLDQFYPEAFDATLRVMEEEKRELCDAERHALGMDHAEIGRMVTERWGLPDAIVTGIAYHHLPDEAPAGLRRNALLVSVAEQTCMAYGLSTPLEERSILEPNRAQREALGLDEYHLAEMVDAAQAGARKSALLLALSR
jgi:putative nucleotidyltransferase with HDIG domain